MKQVKILFPVNDPDAIHITDKKGKKKTVGY